MDVSSGTTDFMFNAYMDVHIIGAFYLQPPRADLQDQV